MLFLLVFLLAMPSIMSLDVSQLPPPPTFEELFQGNQNSSTNQGTNIADFPVQSNAQTEIRNLSIVESKVEALENLILDMSNKISTQDNGLKSKIESLENQLGEMNKTYQAEQESLASIRKLNIILIALASIISFALFFFILFNYFKKRKAKTEIQNISDKPLNPIYQSASTKQTFNMSKPNQYVPNIIYNRNIELVKITDEIKSYSRLGYTKSQIIEMLVDSGWDEMTIARALQELNL